MKSLGIFVLSLSFLHCAYADNLNTQCNLVQCAAGSKVISYATKTEPYYACPTEALSEYTNFVLSLIAFQVTMTGHISNISPETGEPEQEGQTKMILDMLRNKAGFSTFDEAIEHCQQGKNKLRLTVANNPDQSSSIWVFIDNTKTSFWMPKSNLNLHK